MLLCKECSLAEDHLHITLQRVATLPWSLNVLAGVSVLN